MVDTRKYFIQPIVAFGLATTLLAFTAEAFGATFCASNPAEIQMALSTAGGNASADDIRIKSGTYNLTNILYYAPSDAMPMTLSGGWNSDCSAQVADPTFTVIDGGGVSQVFAVNAGTSSSDVAVSNLTIQNGYSTTSGACLFVNSGGAYSLNNVRVTQCNLDNGVNYAGGLFVQNASTVTITDATFDHNRAPTGAAITVAAGTGTLTLKRTAFLSNTLTNAISDGSALVTLNTGSFSAGVAVNILDSTISGNIGRPLDLGQTSTTDIEGTHFSNNTNLDSQNFEECGFIYAGTPSFPPAGAVTIRNSTFQGSGAVNSNCLYFSVYSGSAPGATGTITISDSSFTGFTYGVLPKMQAPVCRLQNDVFANNSGYSAVESWCPSFAISRSRFSHNTVNGLVPAAVYPSYAIGSVSIDNSVFDHNASAGSGGAVGINLDCINGCAGDPTAKVTLTANTFVANSSGTHGGAVSLKSGFDASPTFQLWNNLFWQNTAASQGNDVFFDDDDDGDFQLTPITVNNNAYNMASGFFIRVPEAPLGGANINATDPQFIAAASGDYRLLGTSPMIDMGSASAPALGTVDAVGMPRISGAAPDIGAFEYNADIIFRSGFELL